MQDSTKRANLRPRWVAPLVVAAYALIVIAPVAVVGVAQPVTDHGFVYTIGKNLALCGFTILAMQFILSARIKWIERPFGLDTLFLFHKCMGMVAMLLLVLHPLLLAAGSEWSLLWDMGVSWPIQIGRIALLLLFTHVLLAVCRAVLRFEYQIWRRLHNVLACLILLLGFAHSWTAGGDFSVVLLRVLWVWLLLFALIAYLWHRVVQPRWISGQRYLVADVSRETPNVWSIKLEPPPGIKRYDYLPGQFHFITFERVGLPREEHHWTISSTPTQEGFVTSTIKESGDFTATIGRTKVGDTALLEGPFGRFSYLFHPDELDLVFIAGGIGITPLMSMLRHMRDTNAERNVLLLYANSGVADIVFREELADLESAKKPNLKIIHLLSEPPKEWTGERGRLDEERIAQLCGGDLKGKAFYICAPPALANLAIRGLRNRRVPSSSIHFERFSL